MEQLALTTNIHMELYNSESGSYASKFLEISEGWLETDTDGKISFTHDIGNVESLEDDLIANDVQMNAQHEHEKLVIRDSYFAPNNNTWDQIIIYWSKYLVKWYFYVTGYNYGH